MPTAFLFSLLVCLMAVLTGCAGPSSVRQDGPSVAIEDIAEPAASVMAAYQNNLRRELNKRLASHKGYPTYAVGHELQGDVRVEVTAYGWSDFDVKAVETYGDDVFAEHAVALVRQAIQRTWMPPELRTGNYRYQIMVSYRL